jgi:hypothetical protein
VPTATHRRSSRWVRSAAAAAGACSYHGVPPVEVSWRGGNPAQAMSVRIRPIVSGYCWATMSASVPRRRRFVSTPPRRARCQTTLGQPVGEAGPVTQISVTPAQAADAPLVVHGPLGVLVTGRVQQEDRERPPAPAVVPGAAVHNRQQPGQLSDPSPDTRTRVASGRSTSSADASTISTPAACDNMRSTSAVLGSPSPLPTGGTSVTTASVPGSAAGPGRAGGGSGLFGIAGRVGP